MIRRLCLFLLGFALLCGTANANVIIDDFAFGAQIGVPSLDVDRGGGFTSDLTLNQSNAGVNPMYNAATDDYTGTGLTNGEDFSVTYSDYNSMGATLGAASAMGPFVSLIVPVTAADLNDWNLEVGGIVNGIYYSAPITALGDQVIPVSGLGLENDTTLTLTFSYIGQGTGSLTYGGAQELLEATTTVAAIPEPTTLMMFGSVVGLGLVNRRRRR